MNRAEVISRLKQVEPALRAHGVQALFLYGSYARDEARPESDLDILVELSHEAEQEVARYLAPFHVLEDQFPGVQIGYGTPGEIVSHYRADIERSALKVF